MTTLQHFHHCLDYLNRTNTIPLKLKRRLRYKSYVLYENVRPPACLEVQYLLSEPHFRKYVANGINTEWVVKYDREKELSQKLLTQ